MSRLYSTVRFCSRTNDALSTQRDEYTAGSCSAVESVRAERRKFLSWSASPLVEYTSAVLLNTSWPTDARTRKLTLKLPQFTWLWKPILKAGLAFPDRKSTRLNSSPLVI